MDAQNLSLNDARMLVLEMSVAALIAHLPQQSLTEVASMLFFVAGMAAEVEEIAPSTGEQQLGYVRHWASEMLERVMVSRKAVCPDTSSPMLLPS